MSSPKLCGLFEWNIDSALLTKMVNGDRNEWFSADEFILINCHWKLYATVRVRTKSDKQLQLSIKPIWIPPNWNKIITCITFQCVDTLVSDTSIYTFIKNNVQELPQKHNNNTLQEIVDRKLNNLTFIVNIQLLKADRENKTCLFHESNTISCESLATITNSFEWKIEGELLKEMQLKRKRHIYWGKCFESNIIDNIWCLRVFPMGNKLKYKWWICIEIQFCGILTGNYKPLYWPNYSIIIKETGAEIKSKPKFDDKKSYINCGLINLRYADFQKLDSMTICVYFNKDIQPRYNDEGKEYKHTYILRPSPPPMIAGNDLLLDEGKEDKQAMNLRDSSIRMKVAKKSTVKDNYNGFYECIISADILQYILENETKINDKQFSFNAVNVNWKIGARMVHKHWQQIQIDIMPISMPKQWKVITVRLRCYCLETLSSYTSIICFKNRKYKKRMVCYRDGIFIEEIRNKQINELHLRFDIMMLKIHKKGNKKWFEKQCDPLKKESFKWIINDTLWYEMKTNKRIPKCFESEIFDNLWCLRIYPSENKIILLLLNESWKKEKVFNLRIYWSLFVEEFNIWKKLTARFMNTFYLGNQYDLMQFMSFPLLKHLNQITMYIMFNIDEINPWKALQQKHKRSLPLCLNDLSIPPPPNRSPPSPNNDILDGQQQTEMTPISPKQNLVNGLYGNIDRFKKESDEWSINISRKIQQLEQERNTQIVSIYKELDANINKVYCQFNKYVIELNNRIIQSQNSYNQSIQQLQQEMHDINSMENKQMNELNTMKGEIDEILPNKQCINNDRENIKIWLMSIVKLPQYFNILINNGYDNINDIINITDNKLSIIGIDKIGHRRKIIKYLNKLNNTERISAINTHNIQQQM